MKSIALACALVMSAGISQAATYRFSFVSDVLTPSPLCEEDYDNPCNEEPPSADFRNPIEINILVRLPDPISRNVQLWLGHVYDEDADDYLGIVESNFPLVGMSGSHVPGLDPFELYGFDLYARFATDEFGRIADAYWSWGDEGWETVVHWTFAYEGDYCCLTNYYEGNGRWTIAPVPLPASGLLLLTSLATVALYRRRMA